LVSFLKRKNLIEDVLDLMGGFQLERKKLTRRLEKIE
jgi:hypothetical protein